MSEAATLYSVILAALTRLSNLQVDSLGVGMPPDGTVGDIAANGNLLAANGYAGLGSYASAGGSFHSGDLYAARPGAVPQVGVLRLGTLAGPTYAAEFLCDGKGMHIYSGLSTGALMAHKTQSYPDPALPALGAGDIWTQGAVWSYSAKVPLIQQGSATIALTAGQGGFQQITFPTAFATTPQVYVSQDNGSGVPTGGTGQVFYAIAARSATSFYLQWNSVNISGNTTYLWLALGMPN
jgi:hypothetical protein